MKILPTLQEENSGLRARLGQGRPQLNILLGGSLQDEGVTATFSGASAISSTTRLLKAHKDTRLAAVSSGQAAPPSGGVGGGWEGGTDPSTPILTP